LEILQQENDPHGEWGNTRLVPNDRVFLEPENHAWVRESGTKGGGTRGVRGSPGGSDTRAEKELVRPTGLGGLISRRRAEISKKTFSAEKK